MRTFFEGKGLSFFKFNCFLFFKKFEKFNRYYLHNFVGSLWRSKIDKFVSHKNCINNFEKIVFVPFSTSGSPKLNMTRKNVRAEVPDFTILTFCKVCKLSGKTLLKLDDYDKHFNFLSVRIHFKTYLHLFDQIRQWL